jgi:hypothetical protein
VVDWKAVAGEKETETLKKARAELNVVKADLDQANHLLARRSEQAKNPNLPDAVVEEYYTQMAERRIHTVSSWRNRVSYSPLLRKAQSRSSIGT